LFLDLSSYVKKGIKVGKTLDEIPDDDLDKLIQELTLQYKTEQAVDFSKVARETGLPRDIVEDCARSLFAIKNVSSTSHTLVPGMVIGPYLILETLGHGAVGQVYLVREQNETKNYALKLLTGVSKKESVEYKRFLIEAELLSTLQHPNLVMVKEVGHYNKQPFMIMDLVLEGDLQKYIIEESPIAIPKILELALSLGNAIAYTHQHGILHRDIKPHNILINSKGVKLTDFGIAKRLRAEGTQHTRIGQFLGTLGYVAPEQARGDVAVDERSDIYSFGATLYHMLAGKPPFYEDLKNTKNKKMHQMILILVEETPVSPTQFRPDLSNEPAIVSICMRCLSKNPEDRYPNMKKLVKDLKRVIRLRPFINWTPIRHLLGPKKF
jgi:eukaryotic-like serine/threonine-protein kinase